MTTKGVGRSIGTGLLAGHNRDRWRLPATGPIEAAFADYFFDGPASALNGSTSGTATVTGAATLTIGFTGTTPGTSTVTGTMSGGVPLDGASTGTGTAVATLAGGVPLAGTTAGTSTVTGSVSTLLDGQTAGSSTVTGDLIVARRTFGTSDLFDTFNEPTLNSALWADTGAQPVTVSGTGSIIIEDPTGGATLLAAQRPVDMRGGSITVESLILRTDAYVAFTVSATDAGFLFELAADHGTVTWTLEGTTVEGATVDPFNASTWRWLRIASDPAAPDEVTVWRAPNIGSWVELATVTVADVASLQQVDVTITGGA